jgi:Protein of unknown function (DUF2442)
LSNLERKQGPEAHTTRLDLTGTGELGVVFREFRVNSEPGTLTWADEIDLAPETLYARATGAPLPEWMMPQEALT